MTKAIALEGRGIGKVFGAGALAFRALHPTDLTIYRGEVLVIMGPSGSGKTTLLSLLGLVLTPTEGQVLVSGRSVAGASADELARLRRDHVGFVFQQFNLLAGLTAMQNASVPLVLRGTRSREGDAVARAALELVGMGDKLHAKARSMSGGQQQRVAIARALVTDAGVLLCDEPTASLDGATGRGVLDTLRALARTRDRAVVVVTHDERVLRIADRLVVVEDGRARERSLSPERSAS
ncbi:MAG: ABC transporter ATP-binding protein [Deltaproteobacteria bacterium]|nr:ABC transporter ATP-binding protein [Kofleriaceae bacterium]